MSAREMAARADWTRANCPDLRPSPQGLYTRRVLVQEIPEGMPSFKPGDRVDLPQGNGDGVVMGTPFTDLTRDWRIPVRRSRTGAYECWLCSAITLSAPETSRLIRVTGPEDAVERYVGNALAGSTLRQFTEPHRGIIQVEVVDER